MTTGTPRVERRTNHSLPLFAIGSRTLEEQIRELAEQGYEVQSFNVVSTSCEPATEIDREAEVIVLLRRPRK
jgi:hypothetical protein